jgi:hypothetical protein
MNTFSNYSHNTIKDQHIDVFMLVKPLQGNIHGPNQRGDLEKFINEKEKDY